MLLVENRDLLLRFREGEPAAMAEVFQYYCDTVSDFLQRGFWFQSGESRLRFDGLGNRHDLHDVLAETFRCAFEERARLAYSGLSPYAAYLRTIARNLVIDRLRSKSSQWVALEGDDASTPHQLDDKRPSPEEDCTQRELANLIGTFLDTLSESERQFVELRYRRGLGQATVAEQMDQSRRWVRKLEVELRRRMVRHLRDTEYLPVSGEQLKARTARTP